MKDIIIFVGRECEKIRELLEGGDIHIAHLGRCEGDEPSGAGATILRRLGELGSQRKSKERAILLDSVIARTDEAICLEEYLRPIAMSFKQVVMLEPVDFEGHRIGELNTIIYREENKNG